MKYIITFVFLITMSIAYSQVGDTLTTPNAFTPNSVNNNVFKPLFIDDYTLFVYNRWGNLIYQGKCWDGNLCEQGVYIWNVKLNNGKDFYGTVSLIK